MSDIIGHGQELYHNGGPKFTIRDSGERQEFDSGMVRDTTEGKINFVSLTFGPMLRRWADHLTKGRAKYPDPEPGVPNWTLAAGEEEFHRFRESAFRHFVAWLNGEQDEDHAAGVFFNINGAEYVKDKMSAPGNTTLGNPRTPRLTLVIDGQAVRRATEVDWEAAKDADYAQ